MAAESIGLEGALSPVMAALSRPGLASLGFGMSTGVESPPVAKAATHTGTRNGGKLTQAQIDARAQQRVEDDELIREAQKGDRSLL